MDRPLDGLERAFWLTGREVGVKTLLGAWVRGPLRTEDLRAALDALQARHPALRARFVEGPGEPRFAPSLARVPLRVLPRASAAAWVAEVEAELAEPFPDEGPLARATLLRGTGHHEVLLVFHHAICDGEGALEAFAEVLRDTAAQAAGVVLDRAASAAKAPLSALMPPVSQAAIDEATARSRAAFAGVHPITLARDADAPPQQRRSRIVPRRLGPEALAALSARAKEEGASLQSALTAALLQALAADAGRAGTFGCSTPVNLRPWLREDAGGGVANYSWGVSVFLDADPAGDLWALARNARARTREEVERRTSFVTIALLDRALPREASASPAIAANADRSVEPATVTYVAHEPPLLEGPLTWEAFTLLGNMEVGGARIACYATRMRSAFILNFVHPVPLIAPGRAARIADDALGRLLGAAGILEGSR